MAVNTRYATFVWCVSELQKLWRGVAVDGMDEGKIEEYLRKQGITSMQDAGLKKVVCLYVVTSWHINLLQIMDRIQSEWPINIDVTYVLILSAFSVVQSEPLTSCVLWHCLPPFVCLVFVILLW